MLATSQQEKVERNESPANRSQSGLPERQVDAGKPDYIGCRPDRFLEGLGINHLVRNGMAKLDWEKAAKRDLIRERGSVPYQPKKKPRKRRKLTAEQRRMRDDSRAWRQPVLKKPTDTKTLKQRQEEFDLSLQDEDFIL